MILIGRRVCQELGIMAYSIIMNSFEYNHISILELITSLAEAMDLISPSLTDHHRQVAHLAMRIGEQMKYSEKDLKRLIEAGLLHDIGALSLIRRLELLELETDYANNHADRSADFLEGFSPLEDIVEVIRYHHIPWESGKGDFVEGNQVDELSHVIHLADRIVVLIDRNKNILDQISSIVEKIRSQKDTVFVPEMVDAFISISHKEYIWLDLINKSAMEMTNNSVMSRAVRLGMDDVIDFTRIIANIIDSQSPFTARHSVGVARTAEKLAELAGLSKNECKMMLVAGYVHDFGKLAVRKDILDKNGSLNQEEFNIVKSHTYYTYRLLQGIKGFEVINTWASLHHEKLDGSGYPFHLLGKNIPFGSRIMAVADIFTAISEIRPYRYAMSKEEVIDVIQSMTDNGLICKKVTKILFDNYNAVHKICTDAQEQMDFEKLMANT